ncbi:MAG: hypothetical protein SFV54_18020 [Bryobacteraceae bacterium]|nr:hypothetical protein [Bryobacteraceae bacterium]
MTLEPSKGRHRYAYGRKGEEYVVDFLNVSRHGLSDEEYRVFRYHYLLGADWKLCTVRLGMDRGNFFHMCYRIESRLGRIFRELQPYALYPLDEYFASPMKGSRAFPAGGAKVIPMGPPPKVINPDKLERLLRKRSPAKKAA